MPRVEAQILKPVSFRTDPMLWNKFKARVYEEGLDITTVMTKFIKKFVEDEEFRARVLQELDEG